MASEPAVAAISIPPLTRNRRFQLILTGSIISTLGDTFHSVALSIWVLQATGSATAMSAVAGARILAGILLGAVGGTVADRVDRWRLMWGIDLLRGALVAGIAALVARPGTPFWAILTLTTLLSISSQFRSPAFSASLRQICGVEHLGRAQSLMQLTSTIAAVVGPLLGGTVVALFGGWAAMSVDSASFFISAACVVLGGAFSSPRAAATAKKPPFWQDLTSGLSYIREDRYILGILILAPCVNFFGNAVGVLLPVLAIKVWQASPGQFGILEAATPLGMAAAGAVMMALINRLRRRGWWILGTLFFFGPLTAALGLAPSIWVAAAIMVLIGVGSTVTNLLFSVSMQTRVAPELQGRVFGTLMSLLMIASPISVALAGPLADRFGPVAVLTGTGLALVVATVILTAALPAVRNYDK